MARSRARSLRQRPSSPYLVTLFGLDNALLQAMFLLWISLIVGLFALSATRVITSRRSTVALYAASTLAVTLGTSFGANCMSKGGCNRTALLLVLTGNLALGGSALAMR